MSLTPGTRLGSYEVVAPLGAGGMGEVYRARDTRLDRTVAIKVLSAGLAWSDDARARFEREAKTISQLSHPHISALFDVGREGDTEFLVLEYLEGETLASRIAKGPLPVEHAVSLAAQIADALDTAHRRGKTQTNQALVGDRYQVEVVSWPNPDGRRVVSSEEGGTEPIWSRSGRELFYRNGDRVMVAKVLDGAAFATAPPEVLFPPRISTLRTSTRAGTLRQTAGSSC